MNTYEILISLNEKYCDNAIELVSILESIGGSSFLERFTDDSTWCETREEHVQVIKCFLSDSEAKAIHKFKPMLVGELY